jgi:hypothetical protein
VAVEKKKKNKLEKNKKQKDQIIQQEQITKSSTLKHNNNNNNNNNNNKKKKKKKKKKKVAPEGVTVSGKGPAPLVASMPFMDMFVVNLLAWSFSFVWWWSRLLWWLPLANWRRVWQLSCSLEAGSFVILFAFVFVWSMWMELVYGLDMWIQLVPLYMPNSFLFVCL